MDLIDDNKLDLLNPDSGWKIYTEDSFAAPQYISENAKISNCLINQGCYIEGEVKHSIIFSDVKIGKKAKVIDSVILPGCTIKDGAIVKKCIVNSNTIIESNEKVNQDSKEIVLITKEEN